MATAIKLDDLVVTRHGLENGLRVRHIMTRALVTVAHDRPMSEVYSNVEWNDFDYLPVTDANDQIFGLIEKNGSLNDGLIQDNMTRLNGRMLVSADQSLQAFIPTMRDQPCRLVLDGDAILGIVTRSDLLKMPVRLFTFSLVAHLEMLMTHRIHVELPTDADWMEILKQPRQDTIRQFQVDLKSSRLDSSLLNFAQFCDKRDILAKIGVPGSKRAFTDEMKSVEKLRNRLAHHDSFITDDASLHTFLNDVSACERWINVFVGDRLAST